MDTITGPALLPVLHPARNEFEQRYGQFGGREQRDVPFQVDEVRASGAAPAGQFTVVGHAAVFELWSLDLGFFREKIARGAFDSVLSRDPDVWHLWNHDTRYVLSRTRNKTLELSVDGRGLRMWSRVAPTSYAEDLRVLMERGDIDQSSFAFTVAKDEWLIETDTAGNEVISRTILEVADLYDVTTTAMGAYPQTDSQIARQTIAAYAASVPGVTVPSSIVASAPPEGDPAGGSPSRSGAAGEDNETTVRRLAALRAQAGAAVLTHLPAPED